MDRDPVGHIKTEWPHLEKITDPNTLRAELDIARHDYNTRRLHASLGYVTPDDEHQGRGDTIRGPPRRPQTGPPHPHRGHEHTRPMRRNQTPANGHLLRSTSVLVGMRARLAASSQPRRIFDAVLVAARSAGALSQRRVLDSVPIYDAVATQDTATMLHRAIRAVLAAASDAAVEAPAALRGDYASGARAHCDWDDPRARQELVNRLGADAAAVLAALEAANSTARSARPPSCWPRWPARTCAKTAAGAS